jgi:hypothetical protein
MGCAVCVISNTALDKLKLVTGVGEIEWAFKNTFEVEEDQLAADHVDLIFEGLDTFATVTLVRFCAAPISMWAQHFPPRMARRLLGSAHIYTETLALIPPVQH